MLGMSLVSRMGTKTELCDNLETETKKKSFGTRMNVVPRRQFGIVSCLVTLAVTSAGSVVLGQVSVKISLLGDELLGFYVVSLIKAALVPLLTVTPAWFL